MLAYCEFYINRLRKFQQLNVRTIDIMESVISNQFRSNYAMDDNEYEEDFFNCYPEIKLQGVNSEKKSEFLKNTQNYYLTILKTFFKYVELDTTIFKELEVLQISRRAVEDIQIWRSLSIRFSYLYSNNHTEFKKEFAEYLKLDISKISGKDSLLQWKELKEMKEGDNFKFNSLIKLVRGLQSMSYSNAPIERI